MSELSDLLEQHQKLRASLGHTWNAFFARFGSLRPIQLAAIPPIVSGQSTLVTAPTAGGKTEAIAAPLCERLARNRWPGLSVLLITPTRALVNDLFVRLERPFHEMRIGLGRKTSDHPAWNDPQLQFLITTPESTESLLTFHREALDHVQAIIIDEVHLLDGTARGDQLRLVLQRLSRYLHYRRGPGFLGLQRVAMSATVADPSRLARTFLGVGATIVSVPGQRSIEAKFVTGGDDDDARISLAIDAMGEFSDLRKVLVFVNSRKQVDHSALQFKQGKFQDYPVFGHHGSLSKQSRETTEQRFKDEARAICVATMTLEVGIDIGDIDLVVCLDPPFSLSSFLQRIGRGCRRLQGKTRVLCVARDAGDELMFRALINQAAAGMPQGPGVPFRRSVLLQQVLAYLRQVEKQRRTGHQFCETLGSRESQNLSSESVSLLIGDMVSTGLLDLDQGIYRPTTSGRDFIESSRIYSNMAPTPLETALVDADTGQHIASVASVHRNDGGVRIAGKSYEILKGKPGGTLLVRPGGEFQASPKYHTNSLPYAFDVGICLSRLLGIAPGTLPCLRVGDGFAVFTWLGQLMNRALQEGLRRTGTPSSAKPFLLLMPLNTQETVVPALRQSVSSICQQNPFSSMSIEKIVDLGPYFALLSPQLQAVCREDWLDTTFLRSWADGLRTAEEVTVDSELGQRLLSLSM